MTNREWFKQAKFGLMVHWGLYSVAAGEWKGQRVKGYGEWIMKSLRIPAAEYERLAAAFNPVFFDAREWMRLIRDAGMQYIVVTAKHHEGFCMFRSSWDRYNVADTTPFGRDILAEIAEAAREYGIRLGIYYSQFIDWHEPDGGGFRNEFIGSKEKNADRDSNDWDFPDREKKDYARCFEGKIRHQVRELLTNYGDVSMFWFDTPGGMARKYSVELFDMVRELQPDCLINNRLSEDQTLCDYYGIWDNVLIENDVGDALYESPCTINDTWGYKSFDNNWKTADRILEMKETCNRNGANLLLNVGPDGLGRIPAPSVELLREVGRRTGGR